MDATFTKPPRLIQSPLFYWLRIARASIDTAVARDSIRCRKLVANKCHLRACAVARDGDARARVTGHAPLPSRAQKATSDACSVSERRWRAWALAATSNQFRRCKDVIEYSVGFHPLCTECVSYVTRPRLYINFISSSARPNMSPLCARL